MYISLYAVKKSKVNEYIRWEPFRGKSIDMCHKEREGEMLSTKTPRKLGGSVVTPRHLPIVDPPLN